MGSKKGANENLAIENYKELNEMFYKDYNGEHFQIKTFELMRLLSNPDEYVDNVNNLEVKYGKLTLKNLEQNRTNLINYAKSEVVSTYYHCLETFIRLFVAHSKFDNCPWINIISLSIEKYRKVLEQIRNSDYSFIKEGVSIDELLQQILTGTVEEKHKSYLENVKQWIEYAAMELKDIKEYNSLKHGLVSFNSEDSIRLELEQEIEMYFRKGGDSLKLLRKEEKEDRYVYTMDTIFVDYDFMLFKIQVYSEMINNIIIIGRNNYTDKKVETVKGLIAGQITYMEVMEQINDDDENNIGRFISKYSQELLYYVDKNKEDTKKNS